MLLEFEKASCRHCIHSNDCKRVDHTHIQFAVPTFACYDHWIDRGFICSDFEPNRALCPVLCDTWPGFENYYHYFRQVWTYPNERQFVGFCLDDNKSCRYYVPYSLFAYNRHIDEKGNLRWSYRLYYKRTRKSGTGYKLIREDNKNVIEC